MGKKISVLHILNELRYSGAEVMLKSAFAYFAGADIKSTILSTGERQGDYASILEQIGYSKKHIPFRKNIQFLIELGRYLRQNQFDVVHIHTERANFWYALTAKGCGVKIIIRTVHSSFDFKDLLKLKRTVQRFIMRNCLKVIFIAISESVKTVEKNIFHNNCIIVRNWIDQERFFPIKEKQEKVTARIHFCIPADAFVLVSIGACREVKNHEAIIDALLTIYSKIENIYYLHVGTGYLEKREKHYAKAKGVDTKIDFVGQIDDVRQALIASDIFVMPSFYEGLGNTILESLATGVSVIAYNVDGINSVIQDGYNGLLCETNSDQLAEAVLRLHDDETLKNTIIRNGLNTVREKYSVNESVYKLINLYLLSLKNKHDK